jgi:hypothetical protein
MVGQKADCSLALGMTRWKFWELGDGVGQRHESSPHDLDCANSRFRCLGRLWCWGDSCRVYAAGRLGAAVPREFGRPSPREFVRAAVPAPGRADAGEGLCGVALHASGRYVGSMLFHLLVVDAHDQDGGGPLSDEEGPVIFAGDLAGG